MQFEDFASKTNVLAFASRSKAKTKPQRHTPASSSTRTVPIGERKCTDIEPEDYSPIAYPVWEELSTLLRHGHVPREDGATEFWRLKDYLRNDFVRSQHWSDEMWKHNGKRRREKGRRSILHWSIRTRNSWSPSCSRSFRTQSHWSFITGHWINSERFLRVHLSHRMCNHFTLHHEFMIDAGRHMLSKRQTVFSTSVDPKNKEHRHPEVIDLDAPCLVRYKQKTWKKHEKIRCIGSTSNMLKRKDLSSIKQDRKLSSFTTRSQLIVSRRLS